jgi:hypothetical protein
MKILKNMRNIVLIISVLLGFNGLLHAQLPELVKDINTIRDVYLPSQTLNTTQAISASNTIFPNRKLNYFAGNSILLSPGFKVSAGAGENNTFRAEIRGCN